LELDIRRLTCQCRPPRSIGRFLPSMKIRALENTEFSLPIGMMGEKL
jgi:hypothetical protein